MTHAERVKLETALIKAIGARFAELAEHPHVHGVGLGKEGPPSDRYYVVRVEVDTIKNLYGVTLPTSITLNLASNHKQTLPVQVKEIGRPTPQRFPHP